MAHGTATFAFDSSVVNVSTNRSADSPISLASVIRSSRLSLNSCRKVSHLPSNSIPTTIDANEARANKVIPLSPQEGIASPFSTELEFCLQRQPHPVRLY